MMGVAWHPTSARWLSGRRLGAAVIHWQHATSFDRFFLFAGAGEEERRPRRRRRRADKRRSLGGCGSGAAARGGEGA